MKKLPTGISKEELLKALEDSTESIEKPSEHSVLRFLADFGIEQGEYKAGGTILYKLYNHFTEDPVSSMEFHLILKGFLEYVKGHNYLINKTGKDLTKRLSDFLASKKIIKKIKNPHYRRHFEHFIESKGLKRGTSNIPAQALFYFYDQWQYNNNYKTRMTYRTFTEMLRQYFETKRTSKTWCVVRIDKSFLESHAKEIPAALEWGNKYNDRQKRKKDIYKKEKITKITN